LIKLPNHLSHFLYDSINNNNPITLISWFCWLYSSLLSWSWCLVYYICCHDPDVWYITSVVMIPMSGILYLLSWSPCLVCYICCHDPHVWFVTSFVMILMSGMLHLLSWSSYLVCYIFCHDPHVWYITSAVMILISGMLDIILILFI